MRIDPRTTASSTSAHYIVGTQSMQTVGAALHSNLVCLLSEEIIPSNGQLHEHAGTVMLSRIAQSADFVVALSTPPGFDVGPASADEAAPVFDEYGEYVISPFDAHPTKIETVSLVVSIRDEFFSAVAAPVDVVICDPRFVLDTAPANVVTAEVSALAGRLCRAVGLSVINKDHDLLLMSVHAVPLANATASFAAVVAATQPVVRSPTRPLVPVCVVTKNLYCVEAFSAELVQAGNQPLHDMFKTDRRLFTKRTGGSSPPAEQPLSPVFLPPVRRARQLFPASAVAV
jgi:hypothetical protein